MHGNDNVLDDIFKGIYVYGFCFGYFVAFFGCAAVSAMWLIFGFVYLMPKI